jgi:hypothetical protein
MALGGITKLSVWGLPRPDELILELPYVIYLTLFYTLNIWL